MEENYFNVIQGYLANKQYAEIIEYCTEIIKGNPDFSEAYEDRGYAFAKEGNMWLGMQDLEKAISLNPFALQDFDKQAAFFLDESTTHFLRGVIFLVTKEFQKAIDNFSRCIEINPGDMNAYMHRANAFFGWNKQLSAIQDYSVVHDFFTEKKEINFDALYWRGQSYRIIEQNKNALKDFNLAINNLREEFDEEFKALLYDARGLIHFYSEDFKEAIMDFEKAIEIWPYSEGYYTNLGLSHFMIGEDDKAMEYYKKAMEINPHADDLLHNLAVLLNKKGKYNDAIEILNSLILEGSNPKSSKNHQERGFAYMRLKEYDYSMRDYDISLELDPYDSESYYLRGYLFFLLGKIDSAIKDFDTAITISSEIDKFYHIRGKCKMLNDDIHSAIVDFNTYLYLSIKNKGIKEISELLKYLDSYPQNIKSILDYFDLDVSLLLNNPFQHSLNEIADFTYLIDYYEKSKVIDSRNLLRMKAILYYHLGGPVPAYILFDEEIDDGENKLSGQEQFYYALAAADTNFEAGIVLSNCISEVIKQAESVEDWYYLAQLYLLKNEKENAITYFKKSDSFFYSVIMLIYLSEEKEFYLQKLINMDAAKTISGKNIIDYQVNDLTQFSGYFHSHETQNAINYVKLHYNIPFELNGNQIPLWNAFHLGETNRQEMKKVLRKIEIDFYLRNIIGELQGTLYSDSETDIEKKVLEFKLKEEVKGVVNNIFLGLDSRIRQSSHPENQIAKEISNLEAKNVGAYFWMIKYYYLEEIIDVEGVYTLFVYLVNTYSKKRNLEVNKGLGNILMSTIGLKFAFTGIVTNLASLGNTIPTLEEAMQKTDSLMKANKEYTEFKENLWRFILTEKETLSKIQFNKKYEAFEWFNTYKVNQ